MDDLRYTKRASRNSFASHIKIRDVYEQTKYMLKQKIRELFTDDIIEQGADRLGAMG